MNVTWQCACGETFKTSSELAEHLTECDLVQAF
jgi:hypothetical protein